MRAELKLPATTSPLLLHLFLYSILTSSSWTDAAATSAAVQLIQRGFSAEPGQLPASSSFQAILNDPDGVFSLGFLQVGSNQVDLAVVHLPSSQPVWRAIPAHPARWGQSTSLSFNGSLELSDSEHGVLWSTATIGGDRVVLLSSSNLQIQEELGAPKSVLWQSFDFPSDTIVQGQNFTSRAAVFSTNRRFSMSLGSNYLALYMEFPQALAAMYWKRTPLQAKARVIQGQGPIYARVDPIGFLGVYQNDKVPVDLLSFSSFDRGIPGFRRLTLEADGNLKAYYWNGSTWVLDFQAISDPCELPSTCGAYGLCRPGASECGCLDDSADGCLPEDDSNLCGSTAADKYWVLRRKGVEVANKELIGFQKVASLEECEGSCERNCSCWGALYNNASGFCYRIDYPIQTLVEEGDERKMGYFKVRTTRSGGGGKKSRTGVALLVVGAVIILAAAVLGAYRVWNQRKNRRNGIEGPLEEGLSPGPYKDLNSSSFRSIELSGSFRK